MHGTCKRYLACGSSVILILLVRKAGKKFGGNINKLPYFYLFPFFFYISFPLHMLLNAVMTPARFSNDEDCCEVHVYSMWAVTGHFLLL